MNNFPLDKNPFVWYITLMNDNLMDMVQVGCEESISAADEAQMEHERGVREAEARERADTWAALEATHGPLVRVGWDYSEYDGMAWKD